MFSDEYAEWLDSWFLSFFACWSQMIRFKRHYWCIR